MCSLSIPLEVFVKSTNVGANLLGCEFRCLQYAFLTSGVEGLNKHFLSKFTLQGTARLTAKSMGSEKTVRRRPSTARQVLLLSNPRASTAGHTQKTVSNSV